MKRSIKNLGKQYRFMLVTYIILMSVTILLSTFGYVYAYFAIRNGLDNNFQALLREQQLSYDKEWLRAQASARYIGSNTKARELMTLKHWQAADRIGAVSLISEIASLQYGYEWFETAGMYMHASNSLVTDKSRYEAPIVDLFCRNYGITVDDFTACASNVDGYFFTEANDREYIFFYYNVYSKDYKTVLGTAFCVLSWNRITQDGNVFLKQKNGGVIGGAGIPAFEEAFYELPSGGSRELKIDGTQYIISCLKSDYLDAAYCLYAPKSRYFYEINLLRYLIIAEIVGSMIIGVLLAHVFSKKTALPIEKMRSLLKIQQDGLQDKSLGRLYKNLENSLQTLTDNHEMLQRELRSKSLALEKFALSSILHGSSQNGWVEDYIPELMLRLPVQSYFVVLFSFHGTGTLFAGQEGEEWELFLFAVKNILNEVMLGCTYEADSDHGESHGLIIELPDTVACVVDSGYIEAGGLSLSDRASQCTSFFEQALRIRTYAAVSGIHHRPDELHAAYEEAMAALTCSSFWGNSLGSVLIYDDDQEEDAGLSGKTKLLFEKAQFLSKQLIAHQYELASRTLDEILDQCFYPHIKFMVLNRYQGATLICLLVSKMLESGVPLEEVLPYIGADGGDPLGHINSMEEISRKLHDIIKSMAGSYESRQESYEIPEWFLRAEKYIDDHYCDPLLNVAAIGDFLNVTPAYIGKCFKNFRGLSILDHIHRLRIEKSKELMLQGVTVSESARQTGYPDSKSFIRAFRRYEGITPGQFKGTAAAYPEDFPKIAPKI